MSSGLLYSRSARQARRKSEAERKRRLRKGRKRNAAAFVLMFASIIPATLPQTELPEASYPARLAAYPYDAAQTRNLAEIAALLQAARLYIDEAVASRSLAERYLTEAERMLPAPSVIHRGI